MVFFYSSTEGT